MINRNNNRFGGNRFKALERDGYKCIKCGMTSEEHHKIWNVELTVDHIDGKGLDAHDKNNNLSNLQTLCRRCHGRKDGVRVLRDEFGKGFTPLERVILHILNKNRENPPGQTDMSRRLDVSATTCQAIVKSLREKGYIDKNNRMLKEIGRMW